MLTNNMIRLAVVSLALAAPLFAGEAAAQVMATPDRTISLMVGGFNYDYGGDRTSPMMALRADSRLSRFLLAEAAVSYARADVDIVDHSPPDPVSREGKASLGTATVGLQAELPIGAVRPYAGISTGLFTRLDHGTGGDRFVRTTTEFPVGVRVPLTERLAARGEVRLRFDEHQGGGSSVDSELTFGVGWRF